MSLSRVFFSKVGKIGAFLLNLGKSNMVFLQKKGREKVDVNWNLGENCKTLKNFLDVKTPIIRWCAGPFVEREQSLQ